MLRQYKSCNEILVRTQFSSSLLGLLKMKAIYLLLFVLVACYGSPAVADTRSNSVATDEAISTSQDQKALLGVIYQLVPKIPGFDELSPGQQEKALFAALEDELNDYLKKLKDPSHLSQDTKQKIIDNMETLKPFTDGLPKVIQSVATAIYDIVGWIFG